MERSTMQAALFQRVVLVTGGTRGIGRMIAEGLIERGAQVEIVARREDEIAEASAALGPNCTGVVADLATSEGLDAVVAGLHARHRSIDGIVHNAATSRFSPLDEPDATFERWDKVFRLNVTVPFLLTARLLPLLEASTVGARVIAIGSIDGIRPPMHDAHAYAGSKAALHHVVQMLAPKLGRRGVRINVLAPSAITSRMSQDLLSGREEDLARLNPLGRLGERHDIVGAIAFLLSPDSDFVNGAVIPLDGAVRLQLATSPPEGRTSPNKELPA